MVTTPVAIRSRVWAQLAGEPGIPGAGTTACASGTGAAVEVGAAAIARATDNTHRDRNNAVRGMPILVVDWGVDCVQCPWSDKTKSHTVPSNAKLIITAADPMSLAMPARGCPSGPDRAAP